MQSRRAVRLVFTMSGSLLPKLPVDFTVGYVGYTLRFSALTALSDVMNVSSIFRLLKQSDLREDNIGVCAELCTTVSIHATLLV